MEKNIICPITGCVYLKPVLASDGFFYEEQVIKNWLISNDTSPITRGPISKNVYVSRELKQFIDDYIKVNPDLEKDRYVESYEYKDNAYIISDLIHKKQFSDLIKYKNFDIADMKYAFGAFATTCNDEEIITYFLDNSVDLVCQTEDDFKRMLIHRVCELGNLCMLKYLVSKGFSLESKDGNDSRPIHYACVSSRTNPEVINYIMSYPDIDLNCQGFNGWRPIHLVCKHGTSRIIKAIISALSKDEEMKSVKLEYEIESKQRPIHLICMKSDYSSLKYIVKNGVDIECEDGGKWRPIHYACKYGTYAMIKYMIDKNVDLQCKDIHEWQPVHIICHSSSLEALKYIVSKGINLECETDSGQRPLHIACHVNNTEMIKYLVDIGVKLDCKDKNGVTPTDILRGYQNNKMIQYITDILNIDRINK